MECLSESIRRWQIDHNYYYHLKNNPHLDLIFFEVYLILQAIITSNCKTNLNKWNFGFIGLLQRDYEEF